MELTVADAARRLGVSPRRVRALIERGQLPARRQGPLWVTTVDAVDAWRRTSPGPGRPTGPQRTWRLLADLAAAPHLPDPATVLPALRARATTRRLHLPAAVAQRHRVPPGMLAGGAAAAGTTAVDGVIDLYATEPVADRFAQRLGLPEDPAGNLVLHVVDRGELDGLNDRERLVLGWCDLADRADPAADVAVEALWPGTIPVERLADVGARGGRIPFTGLRAVVDWTARHPRLAHTAVEDRPDPTGSRGLDSLFAAIAETIADDHKLQRPTWTQMVGPAPLEARGTIGPENERWAEVPAPLAARGLGFVRETFWRQR